MSAKTTGSVLILALWALLLLSTLAVTLAFGARQKIVLALRLEHRSTLSAIADAGVQKAVLEILQDEDTGYDTLIDSWSGNYPSFLEQPVGPGRYTVGYTVMGGTEKEQMRYGVEDEERKINLNYADLEVLTRLFSIVGEMDEDDALDLAYCVLDWKDNDSFYRHPQLGAEDSDYKKLSQPYEAKDSEFEILDELLLIQGMTPDLFERVRGSLTVYGDGIININTASGGVLMALGLGSSVVDKIQQFRRGPDKQEGTQDDQVFIDATALASTLSQVISLNPTELSQLSNLEAEGKLGTVSSHFKIQSESRLDSGPKLKGHITCIYERQVSEDEKMTGKILAWKEGVSRV